MTENEIRSLVDDYIAAELTGDNHAWIGEPDADEIMENPKFIIEKADKHTTEKDQVILAAVNATENLLAVKIYNYALEQYAKIDAGEFFDSTTWANFSLKISGDLLEDRKSNWQYWTKFFVNDDIEKNFGKNCIKVCTFDELCNWYDETNAQPFEEWLVEQTGFDKTGIPDDLEALFEELDKTYMDTRFAVCVPENVRQNWGRLAPPLHECKISEIDW